MAVPKVSSDDLAVQATNDDATSCKRYAVQRGYWKDEYLKFFWRSSDRKSPEINRGYYARIKCIQILIHQFLELTQRKCQIVNLGAGFDTLFWLLWEQSLHPQLFVEVDFTGVTARKCQYIKTKQPLLDALEDVSAGKEELHSKYYHLVPGDLRNMALIGDQLLATGLNTSVPTLFLAECVLVYIDPDKAEGVVHWAGTNFNTAVFLNYEPIHPYDRFGEIMQRNLKYRGCSLLGIDACPDLESHKQRYVRNGWDGAWALDMAEVYARLPHDEIQRIEKLDFLDEKELLTQLLQHYCLSCGYSDAGNIGLERIRLEAERLRGDCLK